MRGAVPLLMALSLAACGGAGTGDGTEVPNAATPASPDAAEASMGPVDAPPEVEYPGRWQAVDGRALVVADPPVGGLTLEFSGPLGMRSLPGSVTAEGLRFMRDGVAEVATLMREGARTCLRVADDESYCRP